MGHNPDIYFLFLPSASFFSAVFLFFFWEGGGPRSASLVVSWIAWEFNICKFLRSLAPFLQISFCYIKKNQLIIDLYQGNGEPGIWANQGFQNIAVFFFSFYFPFSNSLACISYKGNQLRHICSAYLNSPTQRS